MSGAVYGNCRRCGEFGALWENTITVRRFHFWGKKTTQTVLLCDECEIKDKEQPK